MRDSTLWLSKRSWRPIRTAGRTPRAFKRRTVRGETWKRRATSLVVSNRDGMFVVIFQAYIAKCESLAGNDAKRQPTAAADQSGCIASISQRRAVDVATPNWRASCV